MESCWGDLWWKRANRLFGQASCGCGLSILRPWEHGPAWGKCPLTGGGSHIFSLGFSQEIKIIPLAPSQSSKKGSRFLWQYFPNWKASGLAKDSKKQTENLKSMCVSFYYTYLCSAGQGMGAGFGKPQCILGTRGQLTGIRSSLPQCGGSTFTHRAD